MKLVKEKTMESVKIGDKVVSFRGEEGTLVDFMEPHKASSSGRVYVQCKDKDYVDQWYPGVIGCEFVEE